MVIQSVNAVRKLMCDRLRITVIIEIIIPRIIHYPVALGIIPESGADFRVLFKSVVL